jgi:hypothetical protein
MVEVGTVRYGELRFVFEVTESVEKFLQENGITFDSMFPKTQFFYQGVLMKVGVDHEEDKELKIIFHRIKNNEVQSEECEVQSVGEKFENFPIHSGDDIYFVDFGVEVKDSEEA